MLEKKNIVTEMKNAPDGLNRKSITAQEIHWFTRAKTAEINQTKTGEVRKKEKALKCCRALSYVLTYV